MHLAPSTAWVWLIASGSRHSAFPARRAVRQSQGEAVQLPHLGLGYCSLGHRHGGFLPFTFDTDIANFEVQPFIFFHHRHPAGRSLSWESSTA